MMLSVCVCSTARGGSDGPPHPSFLLFGGTDVWRDGAFLHGGALWSPEGLDVDGFTLKLLFFGGGYAYTSGSLHADVNGTLLSAGVLPGWRLTLAGVNVGLYAGPAVQDFRLSPNDPGAQLRGLYFGAQSAIDIWYQPTPQTMTALNGFISTVGPTSSVRGALGWRAFDAFFIGPEAQGIWCADYQQLRLGLHITGFHVRGVEWSAEWSAAAGWETETTGRPGPYMRLGMSARY